ncbi:type I-E CRISPR-associated protein Cas5/CasD [Roseibacillus persicicus]|uniref:type I-E CRISPR-associated protein Cas5/CasD n=1 Tax=Roseibacillus persicicus TaxID=454148 RepID=UPI00280D4120|nr:type I-E CRISPR-associated protein Cas5/CasD [Roseibacillus persicicus]MDQ8189671.1 type I-E CRISPR-associated protein Cas5/CasD [Roseibacillus persicicus]
MSALAFYLDAPMQSWGSSSKYQYRETGSFPTKSALIGLVAAAHGIDKCDPHEAEKLTPLSALRLTVVKMEKDHVATTRLMDFHSVGGGYNWRSSQREKMSIPPKASGAPFGTVITRRSYLTDASFIALLEGPSETLVTAKKALLNPVWGVWFGRKTCLPATPLTPTLGETREEAFDALLEVLPNQPPLALEDCEYQEEILGDSPPEGTFYQSDQPTAFGQHHGPIPAAYRARAIRHHRPNTP